MSEPKTKRNDASVEAFLESISDETKRDDCKEITRMMREAINCEPEMWGTAIVGFGRFRYKYASGREGDWLRTGFAPRKQNLTLYIMNGFDRYQELMGKLGKHSTGKSCLYIKRLSDVDTNALNELIEESLRYFETKYGPNES